MNKPVSSIDMLRKLARGAPCPHHVRNEFAKIERLPDERRQERTCHQAVKPAEQVRVQIHIMP